MVILLKEQLLMKIFESDQQRLQVAVVDGSALSSYGRHVSKKQKKYNGGYQEGDPGRKGKRRVVV